MKKTFIGGIGFTRKETDYEELTSPDVKEITLEACGEERLVIKEGGRVSKGSLVFSESEVEPALFSGINGTAESIKTENAITRIVIKADGDTDGDSAEAETLPPLDKPLTEYSAEELSRILLSRGVAPAKQGSKAAKVMTVDCGGNAFNSSRLYLCINYPKQIIGGAKILMKLLGAGKCIFAIPSSCLDAAQRIESFLPSRSSVIKVSLFKEKYPSLPHLTVCAVSNIEISAYKLPENAGYPVVTPHLCLAVYRALAEGIPLYEGYISITSADGKTATATVPYGAKLISCIDVPEDFKAVKAERILESAIDEDLVMKSGLESIAAVKDENYPIITERGCIGCRRCVDVCPGRLLPYQLHNGIERGKLSLSLKNELLSCFECGCCSAVCPSCLPICELISRARNEYISGKDTDEVSNEEITEKTSEEVTEEVAEETAKTEEVVEETAEAFETEKRSEEMTVSEPRSEGTEEALSEESTESNNQTKSKKGKKNKKNKKKEQPPAVTDDLPAEAEESDDGKIDLAKIFFENDGGESK